jgi:N12 class adenine-specific DNA methylase
MPQPPRTSGYDLITDAGAAVADPNNKWRDEYRLMVERREAERVANERRQKDLDAYLKDYADDPWSQTLAKHKFEREERAKQQKRQAEAREQERQKIAEEYPDDPVMQSWALWKNDSEKRKNLPQKQAAAKAEMLEKIAERDATARKLDRVGGLGMGVADAFVRESVGAAVGVVPGMAAIPARAGEAMGMVEPGTTAELHHQAGDFADAQQQAREDDISPWLSRMYGGAAQSFLQAAGTPGGGYSKAIGFGLTTGNEALTTAEDLGMSDAQKWRYAGTQGVIEAGIAMLGQRLLGPGFEARLAGQQVAASTWKTLAKEIGKDALKEIPEEVVTSILQDVSNKLEGVTPDIGFDEFVTHASEAAVQAAMMAGMGGAAQAPGLALRGETAEDPVEAFLQNPSRKKYKAALKAGLPPVIDPESGEDLGESIEGRQQYAEELTRQQEAQRQLQADAISDELQAAMQAEGRILTDEEMGMEPEAQAPETVSEGDPLFDEWVGYAKDVLNQETTDEGQGQGQQLQDEQQGQGQQPLEGQRPDEGQGEQEGVLTEPAPIPQLSQDVEKAAMKIGGEPNVRVRLSELRKQLGDSVGHQELTDHLMEMERRGEIALYPLENPLERTQEDDQAAALSPVGSPSHVLYFIRQKPDLPWEGPGIEPQASPSVVEETSPAQPKPESAALGTTPDSPLATGEPSPGQSSGKVADPVVFREQVKERFSGLSEDLLPTRRDLENLSQATKDKADEVEAAVNQWFDTQGFERDPNLIPRPLQQMVDGLREYVIDMRAMRQLGDIENGRRKTTRKRLMQSVQAALDSLDIDVTDPKYQPIVDPQMPDTESGVDEYNKRPFTNKQVTEDGITVQLNYTPGKAEFKRTEKDGKVRVEETGRTGQVPDYWLADNQQGIAEIGNTLEEAVGKVRQAAANREVEQEDDKARVWTSDELTEMKPRDRIRAIAKARGITGSDTRRYKTLIREILQKQPKAEAKPKPKPKKPRPKTPAQERNLRSIVLSYGGINFGTKDYNSAELKSDGLLTVMRKSGQALDAIAQELVTDGHLRVPDNQNPADYLVEQLKADADSAKAVYTDAEIEAELEAEQQAYAELQGIKDAGIDEDGIAKIRELSEEAGIRAADEGNPSGELTEAEAEGFVDTSFDFGANVNRTGDAEQSAELHDQLLESIREDMRQSGSVMTLISKIRALPQYEGLSKEDFDTAMVDLHKQQVLELSRHDAPFSLKEPARSQQLVKRGDEYYNAVALRRGVPLNPPAEQEAADAESPVKAALRKKMAELQAEKETEAATKPKRKRAPRKKQKPAEVVARDDDAEWWDNELTAVGRRNFLRAAGLQLPDKVMWKNIKEPAKDKLRAQRAGAIDVIESPGAKTPKSARKTAAEKRTEAARARKAAAAEAIRKKLQVDLPSQTNINPLDPEWVTLVAEYAMASMDLGISKFREFVIDFRDTFGEDVTLALSDSVEGSWEILSETNDIGPVGSVAEIIAERRARNEGTGTPDEGVGGSAGELGGTLAGEAGITPAVGETQDGVGPDGRPLPGGTDGTAEAEPGGVGTADAGTGEQQGAGTELGTEREPAVTAGTEEAAAVPRAVETQNLRIRPDDTIAPRGVTGKLKANLAAIKLVKQLQKEDRPATEDEQRVLMQYTGWGSLQQAFDENRGEQYIARPGLPERYGEYNRKSLMYERAGKYSTLEELQDRVQRWEKQWGEAYKFLKETLTKDEWKRASASTLNAHFTSREVITNGIWGAMEQMGVTSGRFLEPSAGIGSLIGLMPDTIAENSEVIAVELDALTGEMVKRLYPQADVHVTGFEDVPIPAGTVDIAATNVPFHQTGPPDAKARYGRDMNLHNYFIARILDSLRPGGIAAVISTHFSMDANAEDRALLASKADLVGAIRLPNNAFKANAGTEVTTDIMFFRKPDGSSFKGEAWQDLASTDIMYDAVVPAKRGRGTKIESRPITVNEYFVAHPEMVLGTHSMEGSQYADSDSATEYTVKPIEGATIAEQLQNAVKNLPASIATADNAPMMPSLEIGTKGVEGRIETRDGKLQEWSDGKWVTPQWLKDAMLLTKDGKPRKRLKEETKKRKVAAAMRQGIAYARVRNAYETHLNNMRRPDATQAEYEASQAELNTSYDLYRKKHGPLNARDSEWLSPDPGFYFTTGLEVEDEQIENGVRTVEIVKSDVFTQRTVSVIAPPTSADSVSEAVNISLAWRGSLNLPWMSELTQKPERELREELLESGLAFQNAETSMLEPADTYLSGNVQAKLRAAQEAVKKGDKRFERNVEALKPVQPAKMTIDAITPDLGADWVPSDVVNQWLADVVGLPETRVKYSDKADIWMVNFGRIPRDVQNEWGTAAMTVSELLPKAINNSTIRVYRPKLDGEGRELDPAQTQAAQAKAEKMRESFTAWAKRNESTIPAIERAFNEQKNFYVKPQYDGKHLTFPGMSDRWLKMMRPYQRNSIWRMIREGRGMLAHGVGAGKTLEMIAAAMEMKRLGLATKPMLVVQNSTLGQFARTFNEVYPTAKVLVASNDDLSPRKRAKFMARIATGNWDAIVMAKSTFNMKLPNDPRLEEEVVEGLISELKEILTEVELADGKGAPSVKKIEQQIKSLEKRLEKIRDRLAAHRDSDVYFEQMGVDALFLDEAHDYKKPPFVTKLDKNIKGLSTEMSARAMAALIKLRYVQKHNRGRNTFMATGTPITNTLGESWLLMNMVAPDVLEEFGVTTFDRFVATFAQVVTSLEPNAVGKLQRVTRLAKFKNGHQLGQFIQSAWDVLLGADLHEKIREFGDGKVPKVKGGKEQLHMVPRTKAFDNFAEFFTQTYDAYKNLQGEDKRIYSWIPVTIYKAAEAASIDIRIIDPTAPDDPGSKMNKMVEGVARAYREGDAEKQTQLIFSDLSGHRDISGIRRFAQGEGVDLEIDETAEESGVGEDRWLYNEIKRKLVEQGIPEDEVQLINDHKGTTDKLLAFQDRVNSGEVRVVIGHSDTLGTGVNVQERLKHIWELDIPMVPAKREQRIGRIVRSGNMNEEVELHVMGMEGSLDGTLMAMNLRKAKAAEQALSGKAGAEFDDPFSESIMSMADMEAAMNDDPLFYRARELEFKIRGLRLDVEALDAQRSAERSRLRRNEADIARGEKLRADRAKVIAKVEAIGDKAPMLVEGKAVTTQRAADAAVKEKYAKEKERISTASQDNKIRKLDSIYDDVLSDHYAVDAEYGPVQFNIFYGERPEVVQDEQGNPSIKWTSTSGTTITMDGQEIGRNHASTYSKNVELLNKLIQDMKEDNAASERSSVEKTEENEKLREFLEKPFEGQIQLENLESELAQIQQQMFVRDNPPTQPTKLEEAKEERRRLQELKAQHDKVILREWKRVTQGGVPASGIPITEEMARALVGRMVVSVRSGVKSFEIMVRELRDQFPEDMIRSLAPAMIRGWNSARVKMGLEDEATQATIDMVLAEKKDADIEEMVDAAKGEPVEPEPTDQAVEPEVAPAEPEAEPAEEPTDPEDRRQYSTKNAFSAAAREYLGMDERAPVDTLPREASMQLAAAVGSTEAGRERINGLIQSLMIEPRAVTPFENDLLNFRNAELGEKHRAALLRQIDAASRGDDAEEAAATADAAAYASQRRVLIEKVLEPIGTEAGRDLQARQAVINEDYSLERSAMMFEAAYKRKPTSEELAKMQEQVNALKEAEAALKADLAATRDQVEDLQKQLAEAHTKATEDVGRPAEPAVETEPEPPSPGVMKKVRERALKDIAEGVDRFKELLKGNKKFSVGGVLDEVAKASLQIAKGFAELGVVKLSDFLVRAERRIGKEAQKYRPQLIEAWKKVRGDAQAAEQRNITGNLDENDPDSVGRVARDLHRFVIERDGLTASAEDRGKAVEAVHEILSTFIDGITIDQVQRAMSGIGIYRPLSQDEIEVVRRDQKAQLLLLEQIRDWERKQSPPKTGPERPPVSQEQRELRRAVNEAKKAAGIVESNEGQLRSAIDAAKRAASNRIADLTKALRTNERIVGNSKVLQDDGSEAFAELRDLRKQRDDLQKLYDETFGPVELTEEQRLDRIEKTLDRAIANLQSDLKTGRLYRDKTAPELTSPAIEAKRAELEALRAVRDEMRLQSGEAQARSDAAYERLLKERDARLAKQIADKDFSPPPKRKERAYTRKQMAMRLEIEKKKQVIRRERKDWEFKNSHPIYKTFVWGPVAGTAIVRKMLTTIDQSYIGRQGYLLGITHPFLYAKSARKAFASNPFKAWSMFPTEQDLFNTVAALDDDAEWVRLEKIAKVAVTDTHGGLNREEDSQFAPEWVNKIPGVGGSERAVSAFINTQRRLVFRSLVDKLAKRREDGTKGLTEAELRVIGNLVNVASGRGNLAGAQQWESALTAAAAVFFSPRWWVSRIQWWTGQPMWSNSRWLGGEGVSWDVRRMVVMEWGKQLAAQAMIMSMAIGGLTAAFGEPGEDEWWDWYGNPLSPNFGKIRVSNTPIDMTAGLGQHLSYLARIFTGRQKNRWEETEIDSLRALVTYGRGKLAPLPSTVVDYLAGKSMNRTEFGTLKYAAESTAMLSMQDWYDAATKEGMPLAPVISALTFFGFGAQVRDPRVTSRKDVVNELRAAKKQGKPDDYVQDMLDEHLKESAIYEAKTRLRTADPSDPERIATLERIAAGQDSPELDAAMEKERQDVALMAAQNLPEEGTRVKSVTAARDLLRAIAPTYKDARELYTQAYRNRYGPTFEVVGNQFRVKKNVRAARRRLLQMYPKE